MVAATDPGRGVATARLLCIAKHSAIQTCLADRATDPGRGVAGCRGCRLGWMVVRRMVRLVEGRLAAGMVTMDGCAEGTRRVTENNVRGIPLFAARVHPVLRDGGNPRIIRCKFDDNIIPPSARD